MPIFSYSALDGRGAAQQGQVEAKDLKEARRILRERSIFVLELVEGDRSRSGNRLWNLLRKLPSLLNPGQYAGIKAMDLVMLFRQTSLMLRSGYTLVTALDANCDMVSKIRLKRVLRRMGDEIRRGASFSTAMAREKKVFAPMVANLVASGEQSGNLDSILDRLADDMEKKRELKQQLVAAMTYPSFVLVAAVGVVIFLVAGVIPRFATFLTARNAELPASTQMLLDVAGWMHDNGKVILIAAGTAIFSLLAATTQPKSKKVLDRAILAIPVIGGAIRCSAMAQAGWSLAILLSSGVTALEALRITTGVINNLAVSDCFKRAAEGLLAGRSLSKAFEQPHIPQMMRHMAAVGESSGQLDGVMQGVGEYYRKELAAKVKVISIMIEPMLIVGIGGMVGFVYFAFFQAVMAVSKGGM
nr:type II secretion system F family protein [uncultured Desulfobulbus sp.]